MAMSANANHGFSADINVTPLIDVLLVLLIIFMVIVPAMPKGEAASVPASSNAKSSDQPLVLEVFSNGKSGVVYKLNQAPVLRSDLVAKLSGVFSNRSNRVLFIKGEDQIAFNHIADAVDLAHQAGADQVGLMTPLAQH